VAPLQTLSTAVDYRRPFPAADFDSWDQEYQDNVQADAWGWTDLPAPQQAVDLLELGGLAALDRFDHEPLIEELFYDGFREFGERR
jgi:hypothetical protein